jgi:hypothetical protein
MDEHGHQWAQTQARTLAGTGFPDVCMRCLLRSDSPAAGQQCDHAYENIVARHPSEHQGDQ